MGGHFPAGPCPEIAGLAFFRRSGQYAAQFFQDPVPVGRVFDESREAHPDRVRSEPICIEQHEGPAVDQLEGLQIPPGNPPPNIDPRVLAVTDNDFSHEIDLIFDWTVNDYLALSFVGAVLVPLKGGREFFGGDETWGQFMIYWSVNF